MGEAEGDLSSIPSPSAQLREDMEEAQSYSHIRSDERSAPFKH